MRPPAASSFRRPLFYALLLIAAWLFLPVVAKRFIGEVFENVQAPTWKASAALADVQEQVAVATYSKQQLARALRDMAAMHATDELDRSEARALRERLDALEKILGMPSRRAWREETCRVIRPDLRGGWNRVIVDKGLSHGILEGSAVLNARGIAGRVSEVHAYHSVVELITSPAFRMSAQVEGSTAPIIFQGDAPMPFAPAFGRVSYVPDDLKPRADGQPHRVVSSGLGGVFPEGYVIGTLEDLKPDGSSQFLSGRVRLDSALDSMREVTILVPLRQLSGTGAEQP